MKMEKDEFHPIIYEKGATRGENWGRVFT